MKFTNTMWAITTKSGKFLKSGKVPWLLPTKQTAKRWYSNTTYKVVKVEVSVREVS